MATYLPGLTDYIPKLQPFTPDYNFYSGALQMKQGKADAAKKQLSSLYGSLLNAPLSREDNIKSREEFFKTIDQDIKKMSTMDLSLDANVQAAKGIFNQMLDNKNLVKDMVWTKQYNNAVQRGEGFKNCVDPEECGGQWWKGGEQYLQFKRDEFINATPDQAMGMRAPDYVPFQNVMEKAINLAKEADLNVSQDFNTGQWIVTKKNGELVQGALEGLFMGVLGNDGKIAEYYQTKAYVNRKNFVYGNEQQYGSKEAAEAEYISEIAGTYEKQFQNQEAQLQDLQTRTVQKQKQLQEKAKSATGSKLAHINKQIEELEKESLGYSSSLESIKKVTGASESAKLNERYSPYQIDQLVANSSLQQDIKGSAAILAQKGAETKMKANPYGVESVKQRNRLVLADYKHKAAMNLATHKAKLKDYLEKKDAYGDERNNVGTDVKDITGAYTVGSTDPSSSDYKHRGFNQFKEQRDSQIQDLSAKERYLSGRLGEVTKTAADGGDVQAQEDYVRMVKEYLSATSASTGSIGYEGDQDNPEAEAAYEQKRREFSKLARQLNGANTIEDQYAIATRIPMDSDFLDGLQIDNFYDNIIKGQANSKQDGNYTKRDYLGNFWEENSSLMKEIESKNMVLEKWDKFYADESRDVLKAIASDPNLDTETKHALQSYIDSETGYTVDKETFVNNMVRKGYSSEKAASLYRTDVTEPGLWDWAKGVWSEEDRDELWFREENEDIAGVHDLWKEKFTDYAGPEGGTKWAGLQGMGDEMAIGKNFNLVDSAKYRSLPTLGTIQTLRDAIPNKEARFAMGNFEESVPEEDDLKVREVMTNLLRDMRTMTKGSSRPILDVTVSNIAGGDSNMMGLNVKFNQSYINKYKGSKKDPGLMGALPGSITDLETEGITLYVPKNATDNAFKRGMESSPLENLIDQKGYIDIDYYPEYLKEFQVKKLGPSNYNISGHMKGGVNPDGSDRWHPINKNVSGDLHSVIRNIEASINKELIPAQKLAENNYLLNQN